MNSTILTPKQALNKAYQKLTIHRNEFNLFKENLTKLLQNIDHDESEENVKNHLKDFLNDSFYNGKHLLNTKDKADLVIYLENKQESKSGVLFEVKRPSNKSEMVSKTNLNTKALQELILYFLNERTQDKNDDIKYLVATNIYEWFIFDAVVFENLFYKDKKFVKEYEHWKNDRKVSSNTDHFYNEIAKPQIEKIKDEISFAYFSLKDYKKLLDKSDKESEKKLIPLNKILSPTHLLKQPFANDSNSLDKNFYNELLHLIGLEEVKDKNKKIIRRKENGNRNSGSLIENAIQIITTDNALDKINEVTKYGETKEEQLFNVALELTLTWINRILFLKLLESQLYNYNKSDEFKFLNSKVIKDYDELYKLFHQVLAVRLEDRNSDINKRYGLVPYLNSSLFEISELENITIKINSLDDSASIDIYGSTVLKETGGRKKTGKLITLHYLFEFLDAYNFTSEGKEEIEDDKKSLINASVLGLIFEKINGYKDGSYFTPGFITMYMSKETIRRAVIQKFNEKYEWKCESFDDLHNHLADKRNAKEVLELNSVINSLKICDPAVGSGHFLVSCLNEIISVKSELGILADESGRVLKGYEAHVENDELIISYDEGEEIFEYYTPLKSNTKSETQRVQETLFREKQTIIENCLFGVDINPNSVSIARLRLWIELLKNAYYTVESNYTELETLPNIDINIKEGNSLVSKFEVTKDLFTGADRTAFEVYKLNVNQYKNEHDRVKRKQLKVAIDKTRERIKGIAVDPVKELNEKISALTLKLHNLNKTDMFEEQKSKSEQEKFEKKRNDISDKLEKLIAQRNKKAEEYGKLYSNAFEWRFEFPEVLDDGNFVGFDIVIGNPPYYSLSKNKELSTYFENSSFKTYTKGADIYCLFYENGNRVLRPQGLLTYITSNSWLRAIYGEPLKNYFVNEMTPLNLLNIEDIQIFEEATVESNIIILQKTDRKKSFKVVNLKSNFTFNQSLSKYFDENYFDVLISDGMQWIIGDDSSNKLMNKIEQNTKNLKDCNVNINFGIKTGLNEAFIINEEIKGSLIQKSTKSADIIKPILRGRDLKKYSYSFSGFYLINTHNGLKSKGINRIIVDKQYPIVYKYLESFKPDIEIRQDQGDHWSNLRNCTYFEEFEKPKIIWGEISDEPKFAYDEDGYFAEATTFIMTGDNLKYLLAILNSKVSEWYFKQIGTTTGMGTNRWKKYKIELLPIKTPSKKLKESIEKLVNKIIYLKNIDPQSDTRKLENEIDQLIYKLYGLTEDEIKIVEGATNNQ